MFIMCTFFRLFDFLWILLRSFSLCARLLAGLLACTLFSFYVSVSIIFASLCAQRHRHCECRPINAFDFFCVKQIFSNYVERTNCAILDDSAGLFNIRTYLYMGYMYTI